MAVERRGPFWDMIEGRLPAPPAARLLGWKLERIDPEQGSIRVQFEGKDEFLNPVGAFAQTLELKTSFLRPARPGKLYGDARVIPFQTLRPPG